VAAKKAKISELHDAERASQDKLTATEVKLAEIREELARAVAGANRDSKTASKKIAFLQRQLQLADKEKTEAARRAVEFEETVSFQLGKAIIESTQSWRNLAKLPAEIVRLRRDGVARRAARESRSDSSSAGKSEPANVPNSARKIGPASQQAIKETQAAFRARTANPKSMLRVASVMDEFTCHSFAPECNLLQLHPKTWREQLSQFKPDLVFIESAWRGLDDLWKTKISNSETEVLDIVEWCRSARIPSVFWNKEDPVHFGTFLDIASVVDYVFTTDIDCIPKYKHYLGHDRVFMLPFAAQPKSHNPVELYERKDAFCFAGSYYLRYPVRQRDFATLIETVKKFKPVEIYDRNFDNPHPHYTFPDKYKSLILGRLPFAEIDRAYKGYRYGINVNTIKESQTMFARRVFELVASNTVVVSNFSRAMRLLFGDLVISSDDASELHKRLVDICGDESTYRKLRLLGLRKVMEEHTYAVRLAYIRAKLSGQSFRPRPLAVVVVGIVGTAEERMRTVRHFQRQTYSNKQLFLLQTNDLPDLSEQGVRCFTDVRACRNMLVECFKETPFFALLVGQDHYGPEYLRDLMLASTYSDAAGFGKGAYYLADNADCKLQNGGAQYRPIESLLARSGIVRTETLTSDWLDDCLVRPADVTLPTANLLSLDEFHYCRAADRLDEETLRNKVEDLPLASRGIELDDAFVDIAEGLRPTLNTSCSETDIPHLGTQALYELIAPQEPGEFDLELRDGIINITSRLSSERHAYIYARKRFSRQELNLVTNSNFKLDCESTVDLQTVFEFYDEEGQKISHAISRAGNGNALAIPEECETVRFGLRFQGGGTAKIRRLLLGGNGERPTVILGTSRYLVLTKQYPAYDDLYCYGFLHSRVRAYKRHGLTVDVFRITKGDGQYYREFEGIDVASGDAALLDETLRTGQYKHVLVHFLDENMWEVLQKHIDNVKVTVWVHGAEIQVWQRRAFEFNRMSPDEIERQKKLSDKRAKLWQSLLTLPHRNLHLVFVSKWLVESASADLDLTIPGEKASVIHNFIDTNIFSYTEKKSEDRLKILVVRPFNKLVYGNDLVVSAILELSRRSFFKELTFTIVGDGELFDQTVSSVKTFDNVSTEKRFLTHSELARYHKSHGIFLVPTRMDTQGVSRDEAMASGLVPITTSVGGVPEFVEDSCGIVVPPEDSLALADAVEHLYKNPELFLELSAAAARRVKSQSGFEQTIQREIALING
jgi:glycosyltransferase involved in cell wall biosynthesis